MSAATVRTVGRGAAPVRTGAPRTSGASRAATARAAARPSARATSRPTARPAGRTATSRPAEGPRRTAPLRLVPPAPSRATRAPFLGVVVGLLALGLLALLALNTSLAENSFRLHELQGQAKVLAGQEQVLRQEVEALQAPEALADRAEALGMVPGGPPAFLRLSDGKVLGKPTPAALPTPSGARSSSTAVRPSTAAPGAGSAPSDRQAGEASATDPSRSTASGDRRAATPSPTARSSSDATDSSDHPAPTWSGGRR